MLVIPSIPAGKMKDQEYDYFYDDEQDAEYCYPGTNILKNKLNIRDLDTLHDAGGTDWKMFN